MDDIYTGQFFTQSEESDMIERFSMDRLPEVAKVYTVTRHTVWQIADPYHILLYIQDGRCTIELDGKTHLLVPGDLFLIPENVQYTRRPADAHMCTMVYAHFHLPGAELHTADARPQLLAMRDAMDTALLRGESAPAPQMLYVTQHWAAGAQRAQVESLLAQAAAAATVPLLLRAMQMAVAVSQVLLLGAEATLPRLLRADQLDGDRKPPDPLRSAVLYVRQHCGEKISLATMCRACAVSRPQMIRYFRTFLNTTPNAYITQYRMNKARELLMNAPQMSVKEISAELGFDDQCYFSRVFTRCTGETPTAYRERVTAVGTRRTMAEDDA